MKRLEVNDDETSATLESSDGTPSEDNSAGSHSAGASTEDRPATRAEQEPKPRGVLGWLRSAATEVALVVVLALVISAVIRGFVGQVFLIPSGSMEDTLQIGDRVAVFKIGGFERGDVVVFADPGGWLPPAPETSKRREVLEFIGLVPDTSTQHLIKRVIGMPGDVIKYPDANGKLTVNGYPLNETDYLEITDGVQDTPAQVPFEVTVPKGRIFVMGDNRNNSGDSRCHLADLSVDGQPRGMGAFVPESDVVGPAVQIVAPLDRFERLPRPATFAGVPDPANPAPDLPTIIPEGVGCTAP